MDKKTLLLLGALGLVLVVIGFLVLNPAKQKSSSLQLQDQKQITTQITPSNTFITYTDPTGFAFSYPDNLSLQNNELKDNDTYAELKLIAKGVNGSMNLKISDSKLSSLDEWLKTNKVTTSSQTPKEMKLGNLKAIEIKTTDHLLLGALDQGVLFTIEIPLGQDKDFWTNVYSKVLTDFSFAPPAKENADPQGEVISSSKDVSFEGEEAIE